MQFEPGKVVGVVGDGEVVVTVAVADGIGVGQVRRRVVIATAHEPNGAVVAGQACRHAFRV